MALQGSGLEWKECSRCGGQSVYWPTAVVMGSLVAPRAGRRVTAHHQPAWSCLSCGHVEPQERRRQERESTPAYEHA